jgi:hypothetical protein
MLNPDPNPVPVPLKQKFTVPASRFRLDNSLFGSVPEKVIVHAVVNIEEALGELPVLHNLQQLHHATLKGKAA